jgi:hypothetical protein
MMNIGIGLVIAVWAAIILGIVIIIMIDEIEDKDGE